MFWWTCMYLRTARYYWTVSTIIERSSTSQLLQWQTRRKELSHWNPAHSSSRWDFTTTELKPLSPQVLSPASWPTGQLPFSIVSKYLEAELHSSCLLNSIVTSFHSFPRFPSLPSHFPPPSCYCLLSATPALAVSPNFLSTAEPTGLWSASCSPLSLERFRVL